MLADNLLRVRQRIRASCEKSGRSADEVRLVCVTKEASLDQMREILRLGAGIFGENTVQGALSKYRAIGDKAKWHLVGHLQTNKAKDAVRIFSLIHSVDTIRLAGEIDKEAKKISKIQDILIQVNVSGEETKFGAAPDAAKGLLKEISSYPNIRVLGLMTIAPEVDDPRLTRRYFRRLKELFDDIGGLQILSMGMSNDFEVAIEEGATMVRIGRAIFRSDGRYE